MPRSIPGAVGTKLITADNNPAFGGVYKLAAVKDADSDAFPAEDQGFPKTTEKGYQPGQQDCIPYLQQEDRQDQGRSDLPCR